jgi:beta-lactamase regulating signal transducer with metallopeptidase domain
MNGLTLTFELQGHNLSVDSEHGSKAVVQFSGPENVARHYSLPLVIDGQNYFEGFRRFINDHASSLCIGWFLIFCFQLVRLLTGIRYINKLRNQRLHPPDSFWLGRIKELANAIGLKTNIELMQSELVKVPMVVGFLKPIILLPVQIMLQLPAEDVEAILLHELAHILRRDFLVNMIQRLATLFYFFNPGLLWISALISEERENCCDELAIQTLGNKKAYISALLSFEELGRTSNAFALAFPGRKNLLLVRVRRILYHQNQTLNNMEKMILAVCLFLIGLGPLAFSQTKSEENANPAITQEKMELSKSSNAATSAVIAEPPNDKSAFSFEQDTVPKASKSKKVTTTVSQDDNKTYVSDGYTIITKGDHQIVAVYYKGKKLSKEEISKQNAEIKDVMTKQDMDWAKMKKEMTLSNQQYQDLLTKTFTQDALLGAMANLKEQKELAELLAENQAKLKLDQNEQLRIIDKKLAEAMTMDGEKMKLDHVQALALKKQMTALQNNMAALQADKINEELAKSKGLLDKISQEHSLLVSSRNFYPVNEIVNMLMDKKIIENNAELSFDLNNDGFTVNNVKQSASVHEEFKKAFLKGPQDHVTYSVNKNSSHVDVSIKD